MNLPKVQVEGLFPDNLLGGEGGPEDEGTGDPIYVLMDDGESPVVRDPDGDVIIAGPGENSGEGGDTAGTGGNTTGPLDETSNPAERKRRGKKKTKSGASLRVVYQKLSDKSHRAYYDGEGTFTINVDHPAFENLEKQDPEFMRRSAEGVAVAYAQAIAEMRIRSADPTIARPVDALNAFMDEHDRVLRPLIEASRMA